MSKEKFINALNNLSEFKKEVNTIITAAECFALNQLGHCKMPGCFPDKRCIQCIEAEILLKLITNYNGK